MISKEKNPSLRSKAESIYEMMIVFAPPKENNTAKYIKFLREATGVNDERKIKEFRYLHRLKTRYIVESVLLL